MDGPRAACGGGDMTRTLTVPVKGIYFDQIKVGAKPFEYRLRTPYWERRLCSGASMTAWC